MDGLSHLSFPEAPAPFVFSWQQCYQGCCLGQSCCQLSPAACLHPRTSPCPSPWAASSCMHIGNGLHASTQISSLKQSVKHCKLCWSKREQADLCVCVRVVQAGGGLTHLRVIGKKRQGKHTWSHPLRIKASTQEWLICHQLIP